MRVSWAYDQGVSRAGPLLKARGECIPSPFQLLEATCMLGSWATSSSVKASYGGGNPSHVHRSGLYSISSHI